MKNVPDNDPLRDEELEVSYPTSWGYRVIGEDERKLRRAVQRALRKMDYRIREGHESRSGKYVSIHVQAVIWSDEQRRDRFWALANHDDVKFVI